jgi:hypothetical protein
MKYKVGDKVILKTWEELEREFGLVTDHGIYMDDYINCVGGFRPVMEEMVCKYYKDRVVEIESILEYPEYLYCVKIPEGGRVRFTYVMRFSEDVIKDIHVFDPIINIFELLDL